MNYLSQRFAQTKNQFAQRASVLYASGKLPWFIICIGIVLRLAEYLFNLSLGPDESPIALNIIERSFLEFLQPLDYNQIAPFGFLILEKLAVQAFGSSEYALRLFPLLFGIVALFLFYVVANRYIKTKAVLISLGLFAISGPLIHYSSEAGQFSIDLTIALLLYLLTFYIQSKRLTAQRIALLGISGAITVWFSYSSVFVLSGIGTCLILFCLGRKEWARIRGLLIACSLWALSFTAYYSVSLHNLISKDLWSHSFMPFPPSSVSDVKWFVDSFFGIFENPVGLSLTGVAALTFLVGCISIFSENKERFFILISPAFFFLSASGLHMYPFKSMFLLFLVPSLLVFIGEGAEQIRDKTWNNSAVIGIILIGLLFVHPLKSAGYQLFKPSAKGEIKTVITHVKEHKQSGDILYLYYGAQKPFKYYSHRYGFNDNDYIMGIKSQDNLGNYIKDLDKLRGEKRVWILFSHVLKPKGINEEKFFIYHMDNTGTRLDYFKNTGASVYLYDLSEKTSEEREKL